MHSLEVVGAELRDQEARKGGVEVDLVAAQQLEMRLRGQRKTGERGACRTGITLVREARAQQDAERRLIEERQRIR